MVRCMSHAKYCVGACGMRLPPRFVVCPNLCQSQKRARCMPSVVSTMCKLSADGVLQGICVVPGTLEEFGKDLTKVSRGPFAEQGRSRLDHVEVAKPNSLQALLSFICEPGGRVWPMPGR